MDITDNNKKAINMQSMCVVAITGAAFLLLDFFFIFFFTHLSPDFFSARLLLFLSLFLLLFVDVGSN